MSVNVSNGSLLKPLMFSIWQRDVQIVSYKFVIKGDGNVITIRLAPVFAFANRSLFAQTHREDQSMVTFLFASVIMKIDNR